MKNPLLTDGLRTLPLSRWKKELRGLVFEKIDNIYLVQNYNFETKVKLVNIETCSRKEYMRAYMGQKRFKHIPGLKVSELAQIKFTSRMNVYKNLQKFDVIPGTSPALIKFNQKIFSWNPK